MRTPPSRLRSLVWGAAATLVVVTVGVAAGMADAHQRADRDAQHRTWAQPTKKPHPTHPHSTTTSPSPTSTSSGTSTSTTSSSTSTSSTSTTTSTTSTTSSPSTTSTTSQPTTWPKPTNVVYSKHVAQWNVMCFDDHYASDDPIVFPGQPGKSHMHTFYGNTSTNASTTTSSLFANVSSCGRGMGTSDRSAYWEPSLMKKNADGTLTKVTSDQRAQIYYRRAGGGMGPGVLPFPKGLRMVAGDAKATSDQPLSVVAWDCGGGGLESPHMYQCSGDPSQPIVSELNFPSCWDGVHLDSADHKSHMAYAASNGACPSSHPVSLPQISFGIEYFGHYGGPDYSLASGGIYSLHADFFAAWDNQVQNALVAACLNGARECADMNRDGNTLFRPSYDPEPITIDLTKYPTTSVWDDYDLQGADGMSSSAAMSH